MKKDHVRDVWVVESPFTTHFTTLNQPTVPLTFHLTIYHSLYHPGTTSLGGKTPRENTAGKGNTEGELQDKGSREGSEGRGGRWRVEILGDRPRGGGAKPAAKRRRHNLVHDEMCGDFSTPNAFWGGDSSTQTSPIRIMFAACGWSLRSSRFQLRFGGPL